MLLKAKILGNYHPNRSNIKCSFQNTLNNLPKLNIKTSKSNNQILLQLNQILQLHNFKIITNIRSLKTKVKGHSKDKDNNNNKIHLLSLTLLINTNTIHNKP